MLNIYKASAGSGKTHTLTKDFIFLLFKNPGLFSSILAVTFTNKAAGEMKERIVNELAQLSNEPQKSSYYNDIKDNFKLNDSDIQKIAKNNLIQILHNYTFFNISTIDSFVQKVIRAFAFELQIPAAYALEMDLSKVGLDITDELILQLDENKNLQNWLTSYAYEQISEGKRWDFRQNIIDFAKQLFKEDFFNILGDIKESNEQFTEKLTSILNSCYSIIKNYEKNIDEIFSRGEKIVLTSGITNVKVRNIGYLTSFFLKNKNSYNFSLNNSLQTAIDNGEWWNKTTKPDVKADWDNTLEALSGTLTELLDYQDKNGKDYFSAIFIKKNIFNFGVLNNLNNLLPEYRSKNNVLLISDLTLLLKRIIGNNDAPFIYEKVGNKFKNIMIDEFQDTSQFQWHNFKPLILNTLSNDEYNLIVGDVKQSIYRWRNGDWRLLHSKIKEEIGQSYIKEVNLETNWRSKKNIIDFNNKIFTALTSLLQNNVENDIKNASNFDELKELLPNAYKDVVQKVASKNNEGGYVELSFFDNTDWKNDVETQLPELIDGLLEKYSPGDIGILVRTNNDANKIMQLLLDYSASEKCTKKFNLISAESLLLANSMAVRVLINALKLILDNENIIFALEIITNLKRLENTTLDNNKMFSIKTLEDASEFLPEEFNALFPKLVNYSLFELVEKLLSLFKLNIYESEIPFIRSFQEVIADYVSHAGADIAGFLEFWKDKSNSLSVQLSDVKDAIQVMTIHKSKGLAFGVVIMPYIDWALSPRRDSIIWADTENTPFNIFPKLPIAITKDLDKTHFSNEYAEEIIYSYMDTLNLIYVAFTRAKERIYGYCKISQKNGSRISDFIHKAITDKENNLNQDINLSEFYDEEGRIFCMGDPEKVLTKTSGETQNFGITNYLVNDWTDNIAIISHGEDLIAETVESRRNAMKYGILMHEIFENITTADDITNAINKTVAERNLTSEEIDEIKFTFERIFQNELVKNWFSDEWEVFSEKEILTRYGTTKIPDRVISNNEEILVIDYKFGSKRPEHKRQIQNYKRLLSEIYPDKKISAYLLYAEQNLVINIS